mgnify:CR=1 FL=1
MAPMTKTQYMTTTATNANAALALNVGSHYFANLVGFPSSAIRVRITRVQGGLVWVDTADILDVATPLVIDASRIVGVAR